MVRAITTDSNYLGLDLPARAGVAGDASSILGLGGSPGGRNGNLFQCSCLGNPMDGESRRLQSTGQQRVRHD